MKEMDKAKIALITGASKGIGAAIAVTLARDGFDIWLNYRSDHEGASVVAKEIEELGRKCILLPFDVSDGEAVKASLMPLLEEETPYALVNNAGFRKDAIMAMMNDEEWKGVLSVTLDGFFLMSKLVAHEHAQKTERAHHQYCLHLRTERYGRSGELFRGQSRLDRSHKGPRGRGGKEKHPRQCCLPRFY